MGRRKNGEKRGKEAVRAQFKRVTGTVPAMKMGNKCRLVEGCTKACNKVGRFSFANGTTDYFGDHSSCACACFSQ